MGLVYGRRDKLVTVAFFLALPYGERKTIHSIIQSFKQVIGVTFFVKNFKSH